MQITLSKISWLVLLTLILVVGCQDRESGQVAALEDPQALASVSGCFDPESPSLIMPVDDEACEAGTRAYGAVVADPTQQWIQLAALDTLSFRLLSASQKSTECLQLELAGRGCINQSQTGARFVDYDPALPGSSGMTLPAQPVRIVESKLPGIVWVVGQNPRVLMAVDVFHKRLATFADGNITKPLPMPISDVAPMANNEKLIFADPGANVLHTASASINCDGTLNSADCELTASVNFEPSPIALSHTPRFLAVDENNDVYISSDNASSITRISLGSGSCSVDDPCQIPVTWECNDHLDNDGDGLVDQNDESCFERTDSESPDSVLMAACEDGIDNDGNGAIDALDEGCGGSSDNSEASTAVWNPDTCTDGIDNDADGFVDVSDPDCISGAGTEFGFGATTIAQHGPAEFPRYKHTPTYPGPITLTSEGDILIIAERGGNRSQTTNTNEVLLACVNPSGEVADVGDQPLCQTRNTLLNDIFEGDHTRENYLGASVAGTVTSLISFTRVRETTVTDDNGNGALPLIITPRYAWATTSNGNLYSIIIDKTLYWINDENDEETTTGYQAMGRLKDAERAHAEVGGLQADIPDRGVAYIPQEGENVSPPTPSDENFYPSLLAIAPVDGTNAHLETDIRFESVQTPEAGSFVQIEPEAQFCYIGQGLENVGCLTNPPEDTAYQPLKFQRSLSDTPDGVSTPYTTDQRITPNGYNIPDEDWTLTWEGSLLIGQRGPQRTAQRSDAFIDDNGWVRFLGNEPCEYTDSQTLCDMEFGWSTCDALKTYCEQGVDICSNDISPCDICPGACSNEANLCSSGVQPGDIMVIPPLNKATYCREDEANCSIDTIPDSCLGGPQGQGDSFYGTSTNERVTYGNQFRITAVDESGVQLQELNFHDDPRWPTPETLPTRTCFRSPFRAEIIAADSWLLGGSRIYGHDSKYKSVDGQCRLREDASTHTSRPIPGSFWTDPSGLRFKLVEGEFLNFCDATAFPVECRHAMRGFRFRFSTRDRFQPQTSGGLGTLSIASAYSLNANLRNPLLLFLDMGSGSLVLIENAESPSSDILR